MPESQTEKISYPLEKIPAKWAVRFLIFPLSWTGNLLNVAIAGACDPFFVQDIEFYLKVPVRLIPTPKIQIEEMIRTHYGVGAQIIDAMLDKNVHEPAVVEIKGEGVSDISIANFVEQIFRQACEERATDIHIEPYQDALKVRYRVDGLLSDARIPAETRHFKDAVLTRIKILSRLNIAQRRLPQDGRFKFKIDDIQIDCRVSVLPTAFGEGMVIRLLNGFKPTVLNDLGLSAHDDQVIRNVMRREHGIIFLTGPTGSGKTTTLYACLMHLNREDRKIITIEDPVEYQLPGVIQVQTHPAIGLTFAHGLRSMLRHDPDVMMVGEVRDIETAQTAIQIALTGHLVFSTLHTNDAASGVTRLMDMGIEPFLITSAVECFIAQRLVRVLCVHCRRETRLTPEMKEQFSSARGSPRIYEPAGCEACRFTGYQGREAIYEILVFNDKLRSCVLSRSSSSEIKQAALEAGMKTLRQSGWDKIAGGRTSCAEVLRVTQEEHA